MLSAIGRCSGVFAYILLERTKSLNIHQSCRYPPAYPYAELAHANINENETFLLLKSSQFVL